MLKRHFIIIIFFTALLASCDNNSNTVTGEQTSNKPIDTSTIEKMVDSNFNDFIVKFSTDSVFQLGRTKFPLKISWHEIEKDTVFYRNKSDFEAIDFRAEKSTGTLDQWEQKIVVDKNNKSAIIEIRGIDNGIHVDYLFEKINGAWMFIEIDDSST